MLPQLFHGVTCYVLGGGASLTPEVCDQLPAAQCIAINSTVRLKPDAAVLYFSDFGWFRDRRPLVERFHGEIVTASVRAKKIAATDKHFHLVRPPTIPSTSVTAGHCALDVAAAMGARHVVLLGFDCKLVDGRSHCHADYAAQWSDKLYSEIIAPMWQGWDCRMKRRGVTVVNATPDSAISEFPRIEI